MTVSYISDSFERGDVICDTGQISPEERRMLEREARKGRARKWRGHWHPVPGASWGIGPLKTCFQRVEPGA